MAMLTQEQAVLENLEKKSGEKNNCMNTSSNKQMNCKQDILDMAKMEIPH